MSQKQQFQQLLQFFKVLGNNNRLQIIGLLANEERNVGELALILDLKEPTVSHHLSIMKEMGLISMRQEGNVHVYWLNNDFLEQMNKDIFSPANLATLVDNKKSAESWEEKVLKTFVQNGRVTDIPARRKKRFVVLKWLVNHFEHNTNYPELAFNEMLKAYHDDHASLRRYLVEEKLMARERNVYWRID